MKIALAQLNYTIGDIEGNTAKIIDAVEKAEKEDADLVLFAEYAVSGTPAYDLLRKSTFLTLCEEALERIAKYCHRVTAIVGSPLLTNRGTVSAAAVLRNGRIVDTVEKSYVTARREMGFIISGSGYKVVKVCGRNIAVMVGDDLSHLHELDKEADFVVSINSRRYGKGLLTYRYETMRRLTYTECRNIIMINQVGGSSDLVYDGTSGVMNKEGKVELMMKSFEEDPDMLVKNGRYGAYIAYSLGNFCFGGNSNPSDTDSMIFQQTFTFQNGERIMDDQIQIIPCSITSSPDKNDYCPVPLEGEEKQRVLDKINEYSQKIQS